jgi:thioredoxin 1
MLRQQELTPRGERMGTATSCTRNDFVQLPAIGADTLHETLFAESAPVLVLCGASWAAPCRAQGRELTALIRSNAQRFAVYGLDVLREEELAAWLKIRVVPTTLLFREGQVVQRFVGFHTAERLGSAFVAAEFPRLGLK